VNFVAHVEVANRLQAAPAEAGGDGLHPLMVGAALPDLAAIGRFRLEPGASTGDLAVGIRVHHRTDDVFHADTRFRELMGRLRGELLGAGLGRGAARACGHVGVELLLDGHLLADSEVVDRVDGLLWSIGRPDDAVLGAVREVDRQPWADHLVQVAERITPESYGAADLVAARLHRILDRRPRLAFDDAQVPVLADALATVQPAVGAVAADLVADTAAGVG
jgi:hypothetical protein